MSSYTTYDLYSNASDIRNLFGVDIDTVNRYVPGLFPALQKNCQSPNNNTDCCGKQCTTICQNTNDCDRNWKDICDDNCTDLVQQAQQQAPINKETLEKVFCDCKSKFCQDPNPDNCTFSQSGEIMDCCDSQQMDCSGLIRQKNVCSSPQPTPPEPNPNPPNSKPLVKPNPPDSKPNPPPTNFRQDQNKGFFNNFSTGGKIAFIAGIILFVLLFIFMVYYLENHHN